jgi:hypothetical protein
MIPPILILLGLQALRRSVTVRPQALEPVQPATITPVRPVRIKLKPTLADLAAMAAPLAPVTVQPVSYRVNSPDRITVSGTAVPHVPAAPGRLPNPHYDDLTADLCILLERGLTTEQAHNLVTRAHNLVTRDTEMVEKDRT